MKISYERLNQIIEEEVVRFKRLNEQETPAAPVDPNSPDYIRAQAKAALDKVYDVANLKTLLSTIQGKQVAK